MHIKEVVVTGQRKVELLDGALDEKLGSNELLIETEKTFISAGTELANYMARDAGVFVPGNWCAYPWRSGYGNVGTVRATGSGVTRAKVGDRVLTYGNHASFVKYTDDRLVIRIPDGMDPVVAAASRMAGVALTAMILSEIKGNPWIVVFGLGAVGNFASQSFVARGCKVIGIDPIEARRKVANRCGIAATITGTPEENHKKVKDLTGGAMGGIVIDAVGDSTVIQEAVNCCANFGQIVILGSPRVPVTGNMTPMLSAIHFKFITVRGALEWCLPMYPGNGIPMSQYQKQEMIFDWMARGLLKLEPLISHRLPPEKISEAYEGLETNKGVFTGIALEWK